MACFDNETATGYLRGDLDRTESAQWSSHLSDCPACQALLRDVAALIDSVRHDLMVAYTQPPAHDPRRLDRVLRESPQQPLALTPLGGNWNAQILSFVATVLIGLGAWWYVSQSSETVVSAQELLQAASAAEVKAMPKPGVVAHRSYTIETRRPPAKELLATQHVEVWVDAAAAVKVRRLFDERRQLVAGEWTQSDGSRVIYERGEAPKREHRSDAKPLVGEAIWRWEPSAKDFAVIASHVTRLTAQSADDGFAVAFERESGVVAAGELTLDWEHLPTGQRVVLRESGGALVEFSTTHQGTEQIDAAQASTLFRPDAELLSQLPLSRATSTGSGVASAPQLDIDRLELLATYVFRALSHRSSLETTASPRHGPCLVRGDWWARAEEFLVTIVLRSVECRESMRSYIAELSQEAGVTVRLSIDDGVGRSPLAPSPDAQSPKGDLREAPLYPMLREMVGRQATSGTAARLEDRRDELDIRIQEFALNWRETYAGIAESGRELGQISSRWPADVLDKLDAKQRQRWIWTVKDVVSPIVGEAHNLLTRLLPLDPSFAPPRNDEEWESRLRGEDADFDLNAFRGSGPGSAIHGLQLAMRELAARVAEHNVELQRLLSSSAAHNESAADPTRLIADLRRILRLAEFISQSTSKLTE